MNNKIKKILKNLKRELVTIYNKNFASMILYGSQARKEAVEGSDIDILILLNNKINPIEEIRRINGILSDISLEFNQIISCVFMSKERYEKEASPLVLNIKKEGIVL